jgi:hypothetical protein
MNQIALRNRVVFELSARRRWVRIEELALSLNVEIKSLVPVLKALRVKEHVEADGKGRVRHVRLNPDERLAGGRAVR